MTAVQGARRDIAKFLTLFEHKVREQSRLTRQEVNAITAYLISRVRPFFIFENATSQLRQLVQVQRRPPQPRLPACHAALMPSGWPSVPALLVLLLLGASFYCCRQCSRTSSAVCVAARSRTQTLLRTFCWCSTARFARRVWVDTLHARVLSRSTALKRVEAAGEHRV